MKEDKHVCLSNLIHQCGDRKPTLRPFGGGGWVAEYSFGSSVEVGGISQTTDLKWFECYGFSLEDAVQKLLEKFIEYDCGLAKPSNDFWPEGTAPKL